MGPTWGRQDPDGSHVGYMNLAIWQRKTPGRSSQRNLMSVNGYAFQINVPKVYDMMCWAYQYQ